MKKTIQIFGFCLLVCLASSAAEKEGEWTSLFNGKDLSGWIVKCQPQDSSKVFWTVDKGTILGNSMGRKKHHYVWLQYNKEFANFELRLKFQAYPDCPGNSGVNFRSRYDAQKENGWMDGPQADINPSELLWRTGLIYDETKGDRHWAFPKLPGWKMPEEYEPEKYVFKYHHDGDGWNEMVIICDGMRVKTIVNGIVTTDWDATGVLDNENHQNLKVGQKGYIALQIHNGDETCIRFKDIRIREWK